MFGVQCKACGAVSEFPDSTKRKILGIEPRSLRRAAAQILPRQVLLQLRQMRDWFSLQLSKTVNTLIYSLYRTLRCTKNLRDSSEQISRPEEKEIAVVCCFFNPSGSLRRIDNFHRFLDGVKATGTRCLVVELAFGTSAFQVTDHDDVIRLRSDDVMWHKERLLNIGIRQLLSESYRKIVWLDGDIHFENAQWPQIIARQLEEFNLCQVFGEASIQAESKSAPVVGSSSVKYFMESGGVLYRQPRRGIRDVAQGRLRGGLPGFGWAARAEVLEKALLFEYALVGGGDKLMLAASVEADLSDPRLLRLSQSRVECAKCGHRNHSPAYSRSYQQWSEHWSAAVAGKVGYAPLHIRDMYHGDRSDRGYVRRIEILLQHDFDPGEDLALTAQGSFRWDSDKPEMHAEIEAYFLSRKEDV